MTQKRTSTYKSCFQDKVSVEHIWIYDIYYLTWCISIPSKRNISSDILYSALSIMAAVTGNKVCALVFCKNRKHHSKN